VQIEITDSRHVPAGGAMPRRSPNAALEMGKKNRRPFVGGGEN